MSRCIALRYAKTVSSLWLLALLFTSFAWSQKKFSCPDGEHIEIDLRQISIQYEGSSIAATLGGLSAFGLHFEVAPKQLHEVAIATQQWDVFLKGLAVGYNNCIISRQQYADGLTRIYPRMKEDSLQLEEIRKAVAQGQKVDARRLQQLIDSFAANLRQFAQLSGKEAILERISALSEQLSSTRDDILNQQKDDTKRTSTYLRQIQAALLESNKPVVAFVPRLVFPENMPHLSDERFHWEQTEAIMRREAARCPPGLDDYPSYIKERSGCDLLILRQRSLQRNHFFAETLYAGPKLTTTIYFGFESFDFQVEVVDCKDEFHTSFVQPCLHTLMTSLRAPPGVAPQEKFKIYEMGAGFEAPMTATFVPERGIFENHPTLSRDLLLKELHIRVCADYAESNQQLNSEAALSRAKVLSGRLEEIRQSLPVQISVKFQTVVREIGNDGLQATDVTDHAYDLVRREPRRSNECLIAGYDP